MKKVVIISAIGLLGLVSCVDGKRNSVEDYFEVGKTYSVTAGVADIRKAKVVGFKGEFIKVKDIYRDKEWFININQIDVYREIPSEEKK